MYCPKCGEANEESDRFCSGCGQDLTVYQQLWHMAGSQTGRFAPEAARSPRIPSYLGWAIAVLILCFWPTGIPAVVYASQVDNKVAFGDISGAQESSRRAKMWCWITFGIGVAIWVISLILVIWFAWMLGTRHIEAGGVFL